MKLIVPFGEKKIVLKKDEIKTIYLEDFESGDRNFTLIVELQGDNCKCFIKGRAHTKLSDKKNWKIIQNFSGKNQSGTIDLRGISEGDSFLCIDGAAVLKQSSSEASATIDEKIILFEKGKGKLIPILRVETDDVKSASHAASIAPVDQEKLLYFSSRGVSNTKAKKIIKKGFLQ